MSLVFVCYCLVLILVGFDTIEVGSKFTMLRLIELARKLCGKICRYVSYPILGYTVLYCLINLYCLVHGLLIAQLNI